MKRTKVLSRKVYRSRVTGKTRATRPTITAAQECERIFDALDDRAAYIAQQERKIHDIVDEVLAAMRKLDAMIQAVGGPYPSEMRARAEFIWDRLSDADQKAINDRRDKAGKGKKITRASLRGMLAAAKADLKGK